MTQGRSFVVITDSLRAEHYENSKGSFKFTHETWSDITRKRDEFPADLQMVGWYHTHPGWGVFLSGMDTFICGHFFNKPLDVALVVDPCQQERAFFQWTTTGDRRTRAHARLLPDRLPFPFAGTRDATRLNWRAKYPCQTTLDTVDFRACIRPPSSKWVNPNRRGWPSRCWAC